MYLVFASSGYEPSTIYPLCEISLFYVIGNYKIEVLHL